MNSPATYAVELLAQIHGLRPEDVGRLFDLEGIAVRATIVRSPQCAGLT
ncbi:MAG: hypothetical protein GY832_19530 [Chloroflexi bacterium]|nr:hypothetical protein [Chloroflexota bacterium]